MKQWQPVTSYQTKWRGTTLTFSKWDGGNSPIIITESEGVHIVLLPDNMCLCELVDVPEPAAEPIEGA